MTRHLGWPRTTLMNHMMKIVLVGLIFDHNMLLLQYILSTNKDFNLYEEKKAGIGLWNWEHLGTRKETEHNRHLLSETMCKTEWTFWKNLLGAFMELVEWIKSTHLTLKLLTITSLEQEASKNDIRGEIWYSLKDITVTNSTFTRVPHGVHSILLHPLLNRDSSL